METAPLVFNALLPICAMIGLGYLARRVGWLNATADHSLMRLIVNLLYPCLIFSFILNNEALQHAENIVAPPLFGFISIVTGFALASFVARTLKLGSDSECRTFSFSCGIYNYAYFAIPITTLLFDRETIGVLLVYNVGIEAAMWIVGVGSILAGKESTGLAKRIFNGPVLAICIAVPANLLGLGQHLPYVATESMQQLGQCTIPLGLLLIGATFADLIGANQRLHTIGIPATACLLRLLLLPILMLSAAFFLPVSAELKQVILVQAAMPCGVFPILLARHYHGVPAIAFQVALATIVLSCISIPLWIGFGKDLLGF
jgi:predicted permease